MAGDAARIEHVAHVGRWLAATGAVLFACKLICNRAPHGWIRRHVPTAVLLAVAGAMGPLVYFGEKALIEAIVDRTDPGERVAAQYLALAKAGLVAGDVSIEGFPRPGPDASPADRTFYVVMGALLQYSPNVVSDVRDRRDAIISNLVTHNRATLIEDHYARMRAGFERLRDAYGRYADASAKALDARQNPGHHARERWESIYQRVIKDGWSRYRTNQADFRERVRDRAPEVTEQLNRVWRDHKGCVVATLGDDRDSARCARVREHYRERARQMLGVADPPPLEWWCREPSDGERIFTGILFGADAVADSYECAQTADEVSLRLQYLKRDEFREASGGYGPFLEQRAAFIEHEATDQRVRDALVERGIDLPAGWTPRQPDVAIAAIARHVREQAAERFDERVADVIGTGLPPGLGWEAFLRQPPVRAELDERLGPDIAHRVAWDMTKAEFADRIIDPMIRDRIHQSSRMLDQVVLHAPQQARDAVYLVVVPPIALGASLLFTLLNAGHLLIWLLRAAVARLVRCAKPGRGAEVAPSRSGGVALLAGVGVTTAIVLAPFALFERDTSSPGTMSALLDRTRSASGPAVSYALDWVLRTEPRIYPVGRWLRCSVPTFCVIERDDDAGVRFLAGIGDNGVQDDADSGVIRWVQQRLAAHGVDPGAIDGLIGPRTRAAVRRFRDESVDLDGETGQISGAVLLRLSAPVAAERQPESPASSADSP